MNWGHSIILGFILFATFVITLVFKMITSGNDLVKPKYYRSGSQINQELRLQDASADLGRHLSIHTNPGSPTSLEIRFDSVFEEITGAAQLICLSDDKADQTVKLRLETTRGGKAQEIKLLRPRNGSWICEIRGAINEQPFLLKKQLRL